MDQAIIEQNARQILHSNEVHPKIIKLADSLNLQSSTAIVLKPTQEPARIHICCALAVEKLGEKLNLPLPDISKPPIPPGQYTKLLNQFRSTLMPSSAEPRTPSKRSTRSPQKAQKTPTGSPRRTPRAARRKAVDYLKDEVDMVDGEDTRVNKLLLNAKDDDGDEYNEDMRLSLNEDEDGELDDTELNEEAKLFSTPRKRPPSGPRYGSPSPRKSPKKRVTGPKLTDIEAIGLRMGLEPTTTDTVVKAFLQYSELVKDAWGLVYGLFVVVSDRAEPVVGMEHERRLVRAMGELVPQVRIDREEWVNWTDKIVTGQTWIMNISKRPEPQPVLLGAPGGWGLGVEFTLVE